MEDLDFEIEGRELWIENVQLRFENSIKPHQLLIHLFVVIRCPKSRYFEDIVNL